MVPLNGPSWARSTSTWIHWWSPVASAKASTRSWVTSSHPVVPRSSPTAASSSSNVVNFRIRRPFPGSSSTLAPWLDGPMSQDAERTVSRELLARAPKVLLHDHLDGGLRPQTIIDLAPGAGHELPATDADRLREWFL